MELKKQTKDVLFSLACIRCINLHSFSNISFDSEHQNRRLQGGDDAPALKPPHEAGGRGGESTARNCSFCHICNLI
ncbi:hypothetical protein FCY55_25530 [Escherichia coli]|nr:hypothetical protein [Escherichia coli]